VLDWNLLRRLRARGVGFATLTHAAGISSTGDPALDARLPFDEPYDVPEQTARAISAARSRGGRVVAVGTTAARALEHAALRESGPRPGHGVANQRIGAHTPLRVLDGIVTGVHAPGESHFELLRAFAPDTVLSRMVASLEQLDYRSHEFGDSVLLWRSSPADAPSTTAAESGSRPGTIRRRPTGRRVPASRALRNSRPATR